MLFSKLRPYLAKALLAPQNGVAVGEILVLSPMEEMLHSSFLLNRVLSPGFIEEVDSSTYGSKMPRASWKFIGEMKIPVPSLKEQQAIVDFIEVKTSKINEATAAIHAQIQTLKAYRQSLISEVVTGKVDVRPAVLAPEADLPLWQQ
ncbi:restriction endonuclease subunit S [Hymenobacter sp. DG25B]|uniref:restriction endonuclease subunit S n=1 Tax=Hymenobacter sp. DG25B TaxID=1385664 RepID=UPI001E4381D3|nr:restriction endonuclease subunit S [Hymenobacter sp. DG25B]